MFWRVGIVLFKEGTGIGDVKLWVVVDVNVTVGVEDSKLSKGCDEVFGSGEVVVVEGRVADVSGREVVGVDGDTSGVGGGVGASVHRPALGGDRLWGGRDG